jgi:hypothetical protein
MLCHVDLWANVNINKNYSNLFIPASKPGQVNMTMLWLGKPADCVCGDVYARKRMHPGFPEQATMEDLMKCSFRPAVSSVGKLGM